MREIQQQLPSCSSIPVNGIVSPSPDFKTPELQNEPPPGLVRAQRIAVQVAEQIIKEVIPCQTEKEVLKKAEELIIRSGGVGVWTPTVVGFGIGTLSCFPTDVASDHPLWNIDLGHVDVHPITDDGWWGDCTRILQVGGNKLQGAARATIQRIHRGVLESAYPGMRACDLFAVFDKLLAETKYVLLDRLQNIRYSLTQNSSYDGGYLDAYNETVLEGAWAVEPFVGNHPYGVKLEDVLWFGKTKVTIIE